LIRLSACDALIFDSDGVLVDSEIIHIAAEREVLAQIGLFYDDAEYLSRFIGLSNVDFHAELEADYASLHGKAFPRDFAERLNALTWPRIVAELEPIPGVAPLVSAFQGRTAVASSAPAEKVAHKLALARLDKVFAPHIYSADLVEAGKPAPNLFLLVARKLDVAPESCAVIEDSVHGVRAAGAAGMMPIGFVGGSHADPGLADRLRESGAQIVVSSHRELRAML
jgi:HAD superfamily hydrolase (TIGR01509 family)